jgi:zinc transporter ZupT
MLPEAIEQSASSQTVGLLLAAGFLFSFLLERCLSVLFRAKSLTANVLLSGAVHSFIDGVGIAVAFSSSHAAGVAITLAVLLHEVPHHIADIGIFIYSGLTNRRAILLNLLATTSCVLGGLLVLLYGSAVTRVTPILLPLTAANFLYIAVGILMPEMQRERNPIRSLAQMAVLIASACAAASVSRIFPE